MDRRTPCVICNSKEHNTEMCTSTIPLNENNINIQKNGRYTFDALLRITCLRAAGEELHVKVVEAGMLL